MPLSAFHQVGRRKRQLDTLRAMLDGVDELLSYIGRVSDERELTQAELDEGAALTTRRERIAKSITETEANLDSARR